MTEFKFGDAIVGTGKDDENSLIASIEKLGADATVQNVTTVKDSFSDLLTQIRLCVDKIGELAESIINLPAANGTGGSIPGFAKGTRKAPKGIAAVAEEGAEIITDGENVVLATEPALVNMQGGEMVYPADVTKRILAGDGLVELSMDGLSKSGISGELYGKVMQNRVMNMINSGTDLSGFRTTTYVPNMIQSLKNVPEYTQVKNNTVNIGDIHLHEVNDVNGFTAQIINQLTNTML